MTPTVARRGRPRRRAAAALLLASVALALPAHDTAAQGGDGGRIEIPDEGVADPYPSTRTVRDVVGAVQKVSVTVRGLVHSCPIDLDLQLTSPAGTRVVLASDAGAPPGGGCPPADGVDLTFDDAAPAPLPDARMESGTYRPANYAEDDPDLCGPEEGGPAPGLTGGTELAAFAGEDPRGAWSLAVVDDCTRDGGSIAGWELRIEGTGVPIADTTPPRVDMPATSRPCVGGTASGGSLRVRHFLSEDAEVTYALARRVDSAVRSECPVRPTGDEPGRYRTVRSETAPASGGLVSRGVAASAPLRRATRRARAGRRAIRLRALTGQARLRPGTYLVTVLARDAAGNASVPASVKFWVLAAAPAEAARARAPARATRAKNRFR